MRFKTALLLLLLVGIGYGIRHFSLGKSKDGFHATLIQLDTARITAMLITPPGGQPDIALRREANGWLVATAQHHVPVRPEVMSQLLGRLREVRIREIATQGRRDWAQYGVDERQGVRVRIYQERQLLEDFIVGTDATETQAFVRISGQEEVYVTDNALFRAVRQEFNPVRSQLLLQLPATLKNLTLEWRRPDTSFIMQQMDDSWQLNAQVIEASLAVNWLHAIRQLHGAVFADDFDEVSGEKFLYHTLTIHSQALQEPLVVQCYRDTTRTLPFVLHSNQNPRAFFATDSAGLFQQLFLPPFLPALPLKEALE